MPDLLLEVEMKARGFSCVCGVDEAGRGPLAGDVYAAAVVIDFPKSDENWWREIDDSKKLTQAKRERLFDVICEKARAWAVARATPREIDEINIRNASFLAMKRAVERLGERGVMPDYALIDGNGMSGLEIPFSCIVKGDSKSFSIAAASILAKVSRDRAMRKLHELHPEYGFASHKGYPTKAHYEAIKAYGTLDVHRKSFRLEDGCCEEA
ncbi:MAG: ribonuclease HII [Clostridiales bacterium]|jgi:ribonuclease HII|nr:ribonuclease HII [Clostridiales bacterium]